MDHAKQYRARNGHLQYKPSDRALMEIIEGDNTTGFCLACGDWVDGVEPDAERDDCPHCGAAKVYGAENLFLRGLYYDGDRAEDIAREGVRA
jgi:rubrerythrin